MLGRLGVDFNSVKEGKGWRNHAIEINLRKGGTIHPILMLQFLRDGLYNPNDDIFYTAAGQPRYRFASDNLENPDHRRLTPEDQIDIAVENGLHFHVASHQGVAFHLIGALSEFRKLGVICVADSEANADRLYRDTIAGLDRESAGG